MKFAVHNGLQVGKLHELRESVPPLEPEEAIECIIQMRREKAPGIENIPVEAYQASKVAVHALAGLLVYLRETERIKSEMTTRTMLNMCKKGFKDDMGYYRGLMSINSRVHGAVQVPALSSAILHRPSTTGTTGRLPPPTWMPRQDQRASVDHELAARRGPFCRSDIH